MRTLTMGIASERGAARRGTKNAPQGSHVDFPSVESMFRTLTERRWALIKTVGRQGPMSIREAARRVERDVKAVHGDVQALLQAGVLWKTEDGKIEFPFDRIHIDAVVEAA